MSSSEPSRVHYTLTSQPLPQTLARYIASGVTSVIDRGGDATLRIGSTVEVRCLAVVDAAGAHSVPTVRRQAVGPSLFGLAAVVPVTDRLPGIWVEALEAGWLWAASSGEASIATRSMARPARSTAAIASPQPVELAAACSLA